MAVFYWVEVQVIHVRSKITFIADQVFPVSPLPDAAFATGNAHRRTPFGRRQAPAEATFNQAPAGGEVRIAGRQFNDAVQVIGQNHPAVDDERMRTPRVAYAGPQRVDVLRQECAAAPSQRVDREEIRPAGVPGASIVGHGVGWQEYGAMRCAYCALRGLTSHGDNRMS